MDRFRRVGMDMHRGDVDPHEFRKRALEFVSRAGVGGAIGTYVAMHVLSISELSSSEEGPQLDPADFAGMAVVLGATGGSIVGMLAYANAAAAMRVRDANSNEGVATPSKGHIAVATGGLLIGLLWLIFLVLNLL
ncbi:MAG: hypothetical protein MPJ50_04880 [Pirellulales bacterium]|nr:hypothetical protein [Pirellulales bacterium]